MTGPVSTFLQYHGKGHLVEIFFFKVTITGGKRPSLANATPIMIYFCKKSYIVDDSQDGGGSLLNDLIHCVYRSVGAKEFQEFLKVERSSAGARGLGSRTLSL